MFNVKDYFQLSKLLKYYNALDYNALSYSFRNVVATQVNSQIMAGQYLEIYNKYKTQ